MDRSENRGESSQRRERVRSEAGRERVRRRKELREKVDKLRETLCLQCFTAPEGRKIGSLWLDKAAGTEPSHQMRDQKLHATVARSRLGGQNGQKKSRTFEALLELEMFKKSTLLWLEPHLEVKSRKD